MFFYSVECSCYAKALQDAWQRQLTGQCVVFYLIGPTNMSLAILVDCIESLCYIVANTVQYVIHIVWYDMIWPENDTYWMVVLGWVGYHTIWFISSDMLNLNVNWAFWVWFGFQVHYLLCLWKINCEDPIDMTSSLYVTSSSFIVLVFSHLNSGYKDYSIIPLF